MMQFNYKQYFQMFLNEDTSFTCISQCQLFSEFLCSCSSRPSLAGLGKHTLSIYKTVVPIQQVCSPRTH